MLVIKDNKIKIKKPSDLQEAYKLYLNVVDTHNKNIINNFTKDKKDDKIININNNNTNNINNNNIDNNIYIPNIFDLNKYMNIDNIIINNWLINTNNNNHKQYNNYKELLLYLKLIYIDLRELIINMLINYPTRKNIDSIIKLLDKHFNNIFNDGNDEDKQPIIINLNNVDDTNINNKTTYNNTHKTLRLIKS